MQVKVDKVEVKVEYAGQPLGQSVNEDRGSDEFQHMSRCGPADFPAKPCKKTEKLSSFNGLSHVHSRPSLALPCKAKAIKTAVSVKKSGSPT